MRNILSLMLIFTHSAFAFDFGLGMAPGMQCPYNYGPGPGSFQGNDEVRNLMGQLSTAERRLLVKEQKLNSLKADIAAAKSKIKRVIKSASAISDIERHYKYKAGPSDYSPACGHRERTERTASTGAQDTNVVHRPSRGDVVSGEEDPGRYAVPSDYCQGGVNDWQHVVAEDGMVMDAICEYEVPLSRRQPDESRSEDCRQGLTTYYAKMAKKEQLEQEVRELRDKVNAFNEDKERIEDQIAEGTYCPYCNGQREGQNQLGTGNFAMMGVALLGALFNRQPQPPPQPMLVAVPRMQPPGMMPMNPGYPSPTMPFPGPAAFPGNPYAAPMPGYFGMQPGMGPGSSIYGAAPGAIGPGTFGCQGTSPFGLGNPLASQFSPFNDGGLNPFANPYAGSPFAQGNPFAQHPLLNPGYGPGFMPFLGNGVNGYNLNDPYNLNPPGMLPFQNGIQNPFGQNPYGNPPGVLPYNGSPWGNQMGNQFGNQWGNQYQLGAPGVLPFPNSNMPFNNPWGSPFAPTPVQNYGYQMNQLRQGINQIGNGQYGAPAVLPYIGSPNSPVYNIPGTQLNPVGRPPTNPGPAPTVRPIRIR